MIPSLEDLSIKTRVMIALAIFIAAVLFLWAASVLGATVPMTPEPPPSKFDTHLIELDQSGLDAAYVNHLNRLFSTWVAEGAKQQEYIRNGLRTARRAYIEARTQLEQRERR